MIGSFFYNKQLNKSITVTFVVTVMLISFLACTKKDNEIKPNPVNPKTQPSLRSLDVTTLISDSGVTRYRITTKEWLIYDKVEDPYWFFPKGIYVEQLDSVFKPDATIKGDTAYFYKLKQLWELRGNVKIKNTQGERFNTEQLFWDQHSNTIYSNKFIHIEKKDIIIEGVGFHSNESMTKYYILKTQGIFPIKEDSIQAPN